MALRSSALRALAARAAAAAAGAGEQQCSSGAQRLATPMTQQLVRQLAACAHDGQQQQTQQQTQQHQQQQPQPQQQQPWPPGLALLQRRPHSQQQPAPHALQLQPPQWSPWQQLRQQQVQQPARGLLGGAARQPAPLEHGSWRGIRTLIPHALAPKPLPRFRKPSKDGRMNRMVIRIPPQVQVTLADGQLTLAGKAGSTSLRLAHLDPTGLVAWQCYAQSGADAAAGPGTGSLLLLVSPSKRCWRGIQTHVDNAVHGVVQGYLVGLNVQGVGYRLEPVPDAAIAAAITAKRGPEAAAAAAAAAGAAGGFGGLKQRVFWEQEAEKTNIAYPHKQPARAVRLKVGYTRAAIFPLPPGVLAFFVRPNLMYLYGIDKALVANTAAALRAVRKPNPYTGNGIQLVGETLRLKQRAGSK